LRKQADEAEWAAARNVGHDFDRSAQIGVPEPLPTPLPMVVRGLWTFQLKPSLAAANTTRTDDQGCFLHHSLAPQTN
jgi:hypothetical protein